jgi:competence ComEA-like helix-hairpin-helix protein
MALIDRDYMRRDDNCTPPPRNRGLAWLLTAGSVIAVASAALWLLRDISYLFRDTTSPEGSLVVNINTATQAELETLPGIGPALATQIMARRPHDSIEDLIEISGIGPKTLDGLRAFVTVDAPTKPLARDR